MKSSVGSWNWPILARLTKLNWLTLYTACPLPRRKPCLLFLAAHHHCNGICHNIFKCAMLVTISLNVFFMTKTMISEQHRCHAVLSSESESYALSLDNRKWKWTQISTKCETMFNLNFHLLHFKIKLGIWTSVTQVFKICMPILQIWHSVRSLIWPLSVYQSKKIKNIHICPIDWTFTPHICHFCYTTAIRGLKILHLKVHKFASRQNSVNYHPRNQSMNCVKTIIYTYVELWIKLHIV